MGGKYKAVPGEITKAGGPWSMAILVCRKCSKKLDGGFGPDGDEPLASVLKDSLREQGKRREVRVIQVGCLDLCPRKGVVVVRGDAPGDMLIVPKGLDRTAIAERLIGPALTRPAAAGS